MSNAVKATFRAVISAKVRRKVGGSGQTLVEYALILAIISVVCVGVVYNLGQKVGGVYSSINSVVASAAASH